MSLKQNDHFIETVRETCIDCDGSGYIYIPVRLGWTGIQDEVELVCRCKRLKMDRDEYDDQLE